MFHSIFIDVATSFYGCAFFVKWSEAKCFLFGTQWRFLLEPGEIVARFATTEALASQRSVLKEPLSARSADVDGGMDGSKLACGQT